MVKPTADAVGVGDNNRVVFRDGKRLFFAATPAVAFATTATCCCYNNPPFFATAAAVICVRYDGRCCFCDKRRGCFATIIAFGFTVGACFSRRQDLVSRRQPLVFVKEDSQPSLPCVRSTPPSDGQATSQNEGGRIRQSARADRGRPLCLLSVVGFPVSPPPSRVVILSRRRTVVK